LEGGFIEVVINLGLKVYDFFFPTRKLEKERPYGKSVCLGRHESVKEIVNPG